MKCLTVRQPWADLNLAKRGMEIRSWGDKINYRGPLLIHAGLKIDLEAAIARFYQPSITGAIIGIVQLTAILKLSEDDWENYRDAHFETGPRPYGDSTFGWCIQNPERLPKPMPYKGRLGLFEVPDEILPRKYKILKDGKIIESYIPGRYAGWKEGKIFGRLDCPSGLLKMNKENRVFFHSYDEAIAEGYRPCKICQPGPNDTYDI